MQAEEPQGGPHEPEQLVYDEVGDDFVMVNGLKLTNASSRKVMKDDERCVRVPWNPFEWEQGCGLQKATDGSERNSSKSST